jgi:hypothetical protein
MRLSDIMSEAGLSGFAMVGQIMFVIAFSLIVFRLVKQHRRGELDGQENMPLEDGQSASTKKSGETS